ncbi:serine hydrolase domain-containing protein [Methylobacterium sp. J-077]|uniref:serine hydrolase domain-containing protein n=1 Tax=Methylobacterium sp. J-077 TaxID=2836656 RepID=UPI001FB9945F|nr:serine hydrolase [Methylobacterium sp. J-077]MCJ2122134.1 beta-lactamase family protein [Methylobacterium sp. J-077]
MTSSSAIPKPSAGPRPGRRRGTRWGVIAAAGGVVAAACAWTATALIDVPNPVTLAALAVLEPSAIGPWFPSRVVQAPAQAHDLAFRPAPILERVPWKGKPVPLAAMLAETHTNAFLVVQDGVLIHEWQRLGTGPTTLFPSWSVAKSIVSLLVGAAVAGGKLAETDRVSALLPELRHAAVFGQITVRDLLDMTSGIAVPENYDPQHPLTGTAGMYLTRDITAFVRDNAHLAFKPGSQGRYRSIDTELLGLILARVEGKPLADLLSERIWKPMGAQADATWNLDRAGGIEKAFCCINATPRDFARLGLLVADQGRAGQNRIIPARWIDRIETPARRAVDGWQYSAQWWHAPGGDDSDISAIGVYGQYVYVNRETGTVIVKLSDHGAEQDEVDTLSVMQAIAADLAAGRTAR